MRHLYKTIVSKFDFRSGKKRLSISDKINIVGIAISAILGAVGILLTIQLSKQKQTIDGFETLLSDNKSVIKKLTSQLDVLTRQLALNEKSMNDASAAAKHEELSNASKLYAASSMLQLLTLNLLAWQGSNLNEITEFDRDQYIDKLKKHFMDGLSNTIVLTNPSLHKQWLSVNSELNIYQQFSHMKAIYDTYTVAQKELYNKNNPTAAKEFAKAEKRWGTIPFLVTTLGSGTLTYIEKNYAGFLNNRKK